MISIFDCFERVEKLEKMVAHLNSIVELYHPSTSDQKNKEEPSDIDSSYLFQRTAFKRKIPTPHAPGRFLYEIELPKDLKEYERVKARLKERFKIAETKKEEAEKEVKEIQKEERMISDFIQQTLEDCRASSWKRECSQ